MQSTKAPSRAETRAALLLGVARYEDRTLPTLTSPAADVTALAEVLASPDVGCFDEVTPIVDPKCLEARKAIARFCANRRRGDLVLFYFSGHGVLDLDGQLHLAATDTDREYVGATGVSARYVTQLLDTCSSQRQVVIIDSCYSGAFADGTKAAEVDQAFSPRAFLTGGFGRTILTASRRGEPAKDGGSKGLGTEHSAFTHFLLDGLRTGGADRDCDGLVSIEELYDFVYEALLARTTDQAPTKSANHVEGRLIVARAAGPAGRLVGPVPNELARPVAPARARGRGLSRRAALVIVGTLLSGALAASEVRRRARYHSAFLALAVALGRYTVVARNYVGGFGTAVGDAVRLALKRVEAVDKNQQVDDDLVQTAAQSEERLTPLKKPYDDAFEDLSFHRDQYFDAVARQARPWEGTTKALVARAQKIAIDDLHYGQIKHLNELNAPITALEKYSKRKVPLPSLVDATDMAGQINERIKRFQRDCDALMTDLERTARALRLEILGVES